MKKIKQGQTKWQVVHYKPYALEGQGDYWVTCVFNCYVTSVEHGTVYYNTNNGPYRCSMYYWDNYMQGTFRKAYRKALQEHYNLYEQTEVTK